MSLSDLQIEERSDRRRRVKEALRALSNGNPLNLNKMFGFSTSENSPTERWAERVLGKLAANGLIVRKDKKWQLKSGQSLTRYLIDDAALARLVFDPSDAPPREAAVQAAPQVTQPPAELTPPIVEAAATPPPVFEVPEDDRVDTEEEDPLATMPLFERLVVENLVHVRGLLEEMAERSRNR